MSEVTSQVTICPAPSRRLNTFIDRMNADDILFDSVQLGDGLAFDWDGERFQFDEARYGNEDGNVIDLIDHLCKFEVEFDMWDSGCDSEYDPSRSTYRLGIDGEPVWSNKSTDADGNVIINARELAFLYGGTVSVAELITDYFDSPPFRMQEVQLGCPQCLRDDLLIQHHTSVSYRVPVTLWQLASGHVETLATDANLWGSDGLDGAVHCACGHVEDDGTPWIHQR